MMGKRCIGDRCKLIMKALIRNYSLFYPFGLGKRVFFLPILIIDIWKNNHMFELI